VQKLVDAGKLDAKKVIDHDALQGRWPGAGRQGRRPPARQGRARRQVEVPGRRRVEGRPRGGREGRRFGRSYRVKPAAEKAAEKKAAGLAARKTTAAARAPKKAGKPASAE
jgi:hypothetical protein